MANRIQTPSKVTDLFGPGKHGFGDDPNPMLATAFDASWCNGVQEEIIRIIEWGVTNGIGVAPSGGIFDQVLTVLKSFPFDGAVTIANGGSLTLTDQSFLVIEADGGNGGSAIDLRGALAAASGAVIAMLSGSTLDVQSGSMIDIKSGGAFDAQDGSTFDLNTDATLAATKQLTLTGDASIIGGAGSRVDVEIVEQKTQRFDDSGTTLPPNVRDMHWLETIQAVRMPDGGPGVVRAAAIPATGVDVAFSTAAAIEDTTASPTVRAFETEPLLITVKFGYRHTAPPATGLMNTRIEIGGPTDEEVFVEQWDLVSGAGWLPFSQDYKWQPDDTYVAPGTRNYIVKLRAGSSLGVNLELRNVTVQVRSAFEV
jgi:hypothetical protein